MVKKFYRINQYITAKEVRTVDEGGKQIGVLALAEALTKAREKGLDLVEVAPEAKPPVCKVIDFKKFKYLEAKKQQESKKKTKKVEIKEVRLAPFIAVNDLNFLLRRAQKFLAEGNKVKISVRFHGRQMTKKNFGYELIKKAVANLSESAQTEGEPKFMGRQLEVILVPIKKNKNVNQKT